MKKVSLAAFIILNILFQIIENQLCDCVGKGKY